MRRFGQTQRNTLAAPDQERQLNDDARYIRALARFQVPGQPAPVNFNGPHGHAKNPDSGMVFDWFRQDIPAGHGRIARTLSIETVEQAVRGPQEPYSATSISWNYHEPLSVRVYWNMDTSDPTELLIVCPGDAEVVIAHNQLTRDDLAAHNTAFIPVVGSNSAVCRSTAEVLPDYESLQRRIAAEPNDPELQRQMNLYTHVLNEVQAGRWQPEAVGDRYMLQAMLDQEVAATAATLVDEQLTDFAAYGGIQPRAWARPAPAPAVFVTP